MLKIIIIAIVVAEIANIVSYQYFRYQVDGRGRLTRLRKAKKGEVMNYLCPGMLGRAEQVFQFLLDDIEGGITLVDYVNTGVKPSQIAAEILKDVELNKFQPHIYAISFGECVARNVEMTELEGTEIVSINPCTSLTDLKSRVDLLVCALLPLANLAVFLLGWGAYLPIVVTTGRNYSLSLAISQLNQIWFGKDEREIGPSTWSLILSSWDEFLDNSWLMEKYQLPELRVEIINSTHANTIGAEKEYRAAIETLRLC